MSVDTQKIIEIVKQVKPLFLDREGSSKIKVKGVADFVTVPGNSVYGGGKGQQRY